MTSDPIQTDKELAGKYRFERPIGSGGFSTVYKATHLAMARSVAIKIFDPGEPASLLEARVQRHHARFQQEARLISQLQHPNTVTLFDFGSTSDGKLYLVMEYVDGITLKELLRREAPLAQKRTLHLFLQLLRSLEEAHHRGMLHRDLKPANIMIARNFKDEEIVKVLDFGLAKILSEPHRELNEKGHPIFLGTPRFAAPEQFRASELSFATDIYSVGALLWESLLGTPMVKADGLKEYAALARSPEPHRVPPDARINTALIALIERAVQKRREDRFPDASSMIAAIEAADLNLGPPPEFPVPQSPPPIPSPPSRPPGVQGRGELLDPNVVEPDEKENFFLTPSPPPHRAKKKKKVAPEEGGKEQRRDRLTEEISSLAMETEVETPDPPAITAPAAQPSRPAQRSQPSRPRRRTVVPARRRTRLIVATLIVSFLCMAMVLSIQSFLSPTAATETAEAPSSSSSAAAPTPRMEPVDTPPTRRSPFTRAGIKAAIATYNWQIMDERPAINMQRFQFHALIITRRNTTLDLTIYELSHPDARTDIIDQIQLPSEYVEIGHFIVRINPRDARGHDHAVDLRDQLLLYRELVLQETSP